jgi:uroporphyrinogen decarboxylase
MRQAGRYLPEYQKLRSESPSLLKFFLSPKHASTATLQPLERYPLDAAIVFSDILILPYALGRNLVYHETGPALDPLNIKDVSSLSTPSNALYTAAETISLTQNLLKPSVSMIGFAGSPWTVACYMIDGQSQPQFPQTLLWLHKHTQYLQELISILTEHTLSLLLAQIKAGAHVVQIFDSWAGLVGHQHFHDIIIKPTQYIVDKIHQKYPHIPVIGFPRLAGLSLIEYTTLSRVDAISLDPHANPKTLRELLPPSHASLPLQGNLNPLSLLHGGTGLKHATQNILSLTKNTPHIFNLGHGILKNTPTHHVNELLDIIKKT